MTHRIKKVYIVPDYQATINDHWYPWLSHQIRRAGFQAKRVILANPFQPDLDEWQQNLQVQMPQLDEHSIIVAHGFSALSVLQFLQKQPVFQEQKIGGLAIVAGFDTPLVAWSELNKMIQTVRLDFRGLPQHYQRAVMFVSSNDPYVPAPVSLRLAHTLNAQIFEIREAGHFCKRDSYTDFPQLLTVIIRFLANVLQNAAGL